MVSQWVTVHQALGLNRIVTVMCSVTVLVNYLKLNPYTFIGFFLGFSWTQGQCYVLFFCFESLQISSFSYIDKFFSEENATLVVEVSTTYTYRAEEWYRYTGHQKNAQVSVLSHTNALVMWWSRSEMEVARNGIQIHHHSHQKGGALPGSSLPGRFLEVCSVRAGCWHFLWIHWS